MLVNNTSVNNLIDTINRKLNFISRDMFNQFESINIQKDRAVFTLKEYPNHFIWYNFSKNQLTVTGPYFNFSRNLNG